MNRAALAGGLLIIAAAALVAYRRDVLPESVGDVLDTVGDSMTTIDGGNANLRAFLRMIRTAEGTAGPDGYRMLFGGRLFDSYADHPRQLVKLSGYTTTAAGAYQILAGTWDEYRAGLPDFGPDSQDECAARLIKRRGALGDVYAGRFDTAVRKCGKEWASLPGSPYGQPVKTMAQVQAAYASAGGAFA